MSLLLIYKFCNMASGFYGDTCHIHFWKDKGYKIIRYKDDLLMEKYSLSGIQIPYHTVIVLILNGNSGDVHG